MPVNVADEDEYEEVLERFGLVNTFQTRIVRRLKQKAAPESSQGGSSVPAGGSGSGSRKRPSGTEDDDYSPADESEDSPVQKVKAKKVPQRKKANYQPLNVAPVPLPQSTGTPTVAATTSCCYFEFCYCYAMESFSSRSS
jgi:hypothetical protein